MNVLNIFYFSENHYDMEFDHLLKGKEIVVQADTIQLNGFTDQQKIALLRLSKLPAFKDLAKYVRSNISVRLLSTELRHVFYRMEWFL